MLLIETLSHADFVSLLRLDAMPAPFSRSLQKEPGQDRGGGDWPPLHYYLILIQEAAERSARRLLSAKNAAAEPLDAAFTASFNEARPPVSAARRRQAPFCN